MLPILRTRFWQFWAERWINAQDDWILKFQITQLQDTMGWMPCSSRQLQKRVLQARAVELQSQGTAVGTPAAVTKRRGKTAGLPPRQPSAAPGTTHFSGDGSTLERTCTGTKQNVFVAGNLVLPTLCREVMVGGGSRAADLDTFSPNHQCLSNYQKDINTGVTSKPSSNKYN